MRISESAGVGAGNAVVGNLIHDGVQAVGHREVPLLNRSHHVAIKTWRQRNAELLLALHDKDVTTQPFSGMSRSGQTLMAKGNTSAEIDLI